MKRQWKRCGIVTLLTLLLQVAWLQPLRAATDDTKPVWQTTDPKAGYYLSGRRALVGSGCMVNRLGSDGVTVVPVITNLENLCDEDLTNVTEIGFGAEVTVAESPLISVCDVKNHYKAGTQAGFVVTGSASGLLSLNLVDFFQILFYCEGKQVGTAQTISQGQTANGVGLSLVQISSSAASKEYVATAPGEFDEIRIVQVKALGIDAATKIGLKYAFVGEAKGYTLTQTAMKNYNSDLKVQSNSTTLGTVFTPVENKLGSTWNTGGRLDDDDLTNTTAIEGVLTLGQSPRAMVRAIPQSSSDEAFPKGTTVGFKFHQASALSIDAGAGYVIRLYNRNGDIVDSKLLNMTALGISVAEGSDAQFSITADSAFSQAAFTIDGVQVKIGGVSVYYAYIMPKPEIELHHCDINASANLNVCDCDDSYQLTASKDVSWKVIAQPTGSTAAVDGAGKLTGLNVAGVYQVSATAADGCADTVTVNYGTSNDFVAAETGITRLTGSDYVATSGNSASISLFSSLKNSNAITTPSLRDYAYTTAGASLLGKEHVVSVKKNDGSTFSYEKDKYVGFIVLAKTTAINANLLDFLTVDLYKNGTKVSGSLVKNNAVLSADLINTSGSAAQRTAYTVKVPAGTEFDEIALNKIGTLSVDLSQLNIYYAYVSDNDGNPETTGTIVSYKNTGASIDAANTSFVAVANVVNTPFGLTELVDNDLTTGVTLPAVSVANGTKIGVKLGRTINHEKQNLLIVTSNTSAVLSADLVKVLKVELYKAGVKVADNATGTGVDVLNANVLGYTNTHSYVNVSSATSDFDEVVMTYGNGATVADAFKIYGILLRGDYNADGVPDESDPEPCAQELVLDEDVSLNKTKNYTKARLIFHRTFNADAWNSVILPVDLTKAQFNEAFGADAKLSAVDNVTTQTETTDNTTTTTTTLVFKTVSDETDGVFMAKNTPYIIYMSSATLADHSDAARYESIDDGEVTGPLFLVDNGISYDKSDNYETTHDAGTDFVLTGSYNAAQALAAGSYVFSKGNLVHTIKDHTQKAYRCWISYTGNDSNAQLKGFSVDDDATTAIHSVTTENSVGGALYNLMGQRASAPSVPGLYILGGKKVLVK